MPKPCSSCLFSYRCLARRYDNYTKVLSDVFSLNSLEDSCFKVAQSHAEQNGEITNTVIKFFTPGHAKPGFRLQITKINWLITHDEDQPVRTS